MKPLVILITVCCFSVAIAEPSQQEGTLLSRIVDLESRVASLERQLRDLLNRTETAPAKKFTSGDWKNLGTWREGMRRGLSKAQVRSLLGEPTKVSTFEYGVDWWYYGYPTGGKVEFDDQGTVTSWSEP